MPSVVSSINAPAKDMSPPALRTTSGKNGAVGARLISSNPAACASSSGMNLIMSHASAGPTTQPQSRIRPTAWALRRVFSASRISMRNGNCFE